MSGSRICRSVRTGLLTTIAACCAIATVRAIDPERGLSQYIRTRWESSSGFPGGYVYAITQATDGYLWIAAEKGLVRFDGSHYRLVQPREMTSGSDTTALELEPAPGGGLWARLRRAAFVRFHDGLFEEAIKRDALPNSRVTAIATAHDGAILIADANEGLIAVRAGRSDLVVPRRALSGSSITAIAQASNGDLWLGTLDAGLLQVHDRRVTRISDGLPDQKINCLLTDARDRAWIGTDHGVFRWNGGRITQVPLEPASGDLRALSMIEDRDGNIWIGTADGLLRLRGDGPASLDRRTRATSVTALFEDRDGDLWIGTATGIERWRDGAFTTYADDGARAADIAGPVLVDAAGRAWFAPSSGGLYWRRQGQVGRITGDGLRDDVVYSIAGEGDDLWIGRQHGGLTHLHLHPRTDAVITMRTFTTADGLAQNNVYAVHRARDGSVWAGTLSAGASRLADGVFTTYTTADGLSSNTVASVLEASDGTMWFATPNGLTARTASGWRRYSNADGLPSDDVNTLFEDSVHDMWIGTAGGLALVRAGRIYAGLRPPESLQTSILGIAEDRLGWLWITTTQHVLRVDRQRLLLGSTGSDSLREFGIADGLPGIAGIKRHRSVAADAQGRIWISTDGGLAMADPLRIARGCAPALVHVEDLSADGSPVALAALSTVEPRRQRITLTFAGLSFPVPERVRYRYWLEGFDHEWSEPVTERQAVYTNLGPGTYRFRVIASNSDGAWNGTEASLPFIIEPAFWQTAWFQLSGVLLGVTAAWAAYRLRVVQVSRQLTLRFEERLAERTRVAQELHDTLLQGVISASMQLHVAAIQLPGDSDSQPALSRVIDLIGRVITEARTAVQGLRSSSTASTGLEHAFSAIPEEIGTSGPAAYRVIVEGRDRPLNPLIRDEVYRIGREAVVNAFRHAEARTIELVLEYAASGLRLVVRDDGRGIGAGVLQSGSEGHWGLTGMRERADRIGARFKAWSRTGAGTEIELSVPARIAFLREKHSRAPRPARLSERNLP